MSAARARDSAARARDKGLKALTALDTLLEKETKAIGHAEVATAITCVVGYRNGLVEARREGECTTAELDRVNALLSLCHGAEFPLVGFHRDRLAKARDEIQDMLAR